MQLVAAHQFKLLHLERGRVRKSGPAIVGVRKDAFESVERVDDATLRFTISTSAVDRDMDSVDVRGWKLDNFRKNPVVLWAHRADEFPVGQAVDIGTDERRLYSAVKFIPPEGYGSASELADTVYRLARDGWIRATSVGFRPIAWDVTTDKDRGGDGWMPGIDFHEQELVEFSLVSVPSNPDALAEEDVLPGDFGNDSAAVITPAPVQIISYQAERIKRRARAALLGVF